MPEATQDIHDSPELDAGVNALVSDVESARPQSNPNPEAEASQPAASPIPPAPPPVPPPPAAAPPPVAAPPNPTETPAPAPAAEPDLAKAVEDLLIDARSDSSETHVSPPVAATQTAHIDSLDAELAGLADDLISGEFADEAHALADATTPTVPVAAAAPPADAAPPKPLAGELPSPAVPRSAPAAAVSKAPPSPDTKAEPKPEPAKAEPSVPKAPRRTPRQRLVPVFNVVSPAALKVFALLSSPLRKQPQHIRDIIGWFAIVNAFLALCVWGYLLLFPRTATLTPRAHVAPAKQEAAAEPAEHGEKKPEKAAKEHAKPKSSTKKTAAASKGGAHH